MTPDVQAAIDAARLRTGGLVSDGESSGEEDEVVQRYPVRARQPPNRYGAERAGASANAASMQPASEPVFVRDLPPPPKTVAEARGLEYWPVCEAALREERQSMVDHSVWKKQKAPRGVARLKTKVIFDYKASQCGELVRDKWRLVGQGNRQKPGRDSLESWADMPAAATTRCLLATAAARGWHVHQRRRGRRRGRRRRRWGDR